MNFSIEIKAPELANAINKLAVALSGSQLYTKESFDNLCGQSQTSVPQQPVQQAEPVTAPIQQQPVQTSFQQSAPTAVPTTVPQQQAPTQPVQEHQPQQTVPTSSPTYSMDQLAVAATQLVDAGKREDLLQLLSSFGVQALTALPQEQYGAFATKLRELGAKI